MPSTVASFIFSGTTGFGTFCAFFSAVAGTYSPFFSVLVEFHCALSTTSCRTQRQTRKRCARRSEVLDSKVKPLTGRRRRYQPADEYRWGAGSQRQPHRHR